MIRLGVIIRSAVVFLLALLGANLTWVAFIIIVDLFCGVRPQTALPLFPVAFIAVTLLLMVRALRHVRVTETQAGDPIPDRGVPAAETVSDVKQPQPGNSIPGRTAPPAETVSEVKPHSRKAILRSMLIVNRKTAAATSEVKGKV
ncbi:MAG TPA: hypothetical protein VGN86_12440 [Pyrinomonadaceae bacterium]|jgi:hypothetical protein|nr:hypothetical protein [Pyrinomonadaceae bacterium]